MLKHKLRIAFEELIRERNSGGNILLEAVSLLLIGIIMFIGAVNNYNKDAVEDILKQDLKDTGVISINDNNQYEMYDTKEGYDKFTEASLRTYNMFIDAIKSAECIENPMEYRWLEFDVNACTDNNKNYIFKKSFDISKSRDDSYMTFSEEEIGNHIDALYVGGDYEKLFNISVSTEYSEAEQDKLLLKYSGIIYMGNALEHIKQGTIVRTANGENYIVGGTIKKDAKMPKIDNVSEQTTAYEEMNYKMLIVEDIKSISSASETMCFKVKEGYSVNDARAEITEIAQKINYGTTVKSFKGIFNNIELKNKTFINFIEQILFVVMITVIILQVSMQAVHIIENFGNYGILYANGFSAFDHFTIFLIQNILKGITAVFLTLGAGYLILDIFYSDSICMYSLYVLYTVILKYVLWKVLMCALAIAILTTIVAFGLFYRKPPSVLIKENK